MFKFIKDKLKKVVSKFSKEVEEEVKEVKEVEKVKRIEEVEEEIEEKIKEKKEKEKIKEKEKPKEKPKKEVKKKKEIKEEIKKKEKIKKEKEIKKEKPEIKKEEEKPKKKLIEIIKERVTKKVISEKRFEDLFRDLELVLLENNVAVEVIDKIKEDLKMELVGVPLERTRVKDIIRKTLRESIEDLFKVKGIDLLEKVREKRPFVIVFVGINGSGKTTTIAKMGRLFLDKNLSCVFAASDTFRAASQEQLEEHAKRLNVKVIKHSYGADPAAVAFDAIKHAQAHKIDVVLVDTAGRLHSDVNLMDEMKKIVRVSKPDLVIFVGEAITGNDCVEQAKRFNEAVGVDGIVLAKADVDEKGGAAISVSYVTQKPIMFLGTGQKYEDLKEFSPEIVVEGLGL